MKSIYNIGVRLGGLAARLLLTLYVLRYLGVDAVGKMGLVLGLVAILPPIAGLGLHYYMNREIIDAPLNRAVPAILNRLAVTTTFAVVGAIAYIAVDTAVLHSSIEFRAVVATICVMESIASEIHLCLISRDRSTRANNLYFVRNGAWVLPCAAYGLLMPDARNINVVLLFWCAALVASNLFILSRAAPYIEFRTVLGQVHYLAALSESKKTWLIYAGDIGNVLYLYADRFVLSLIMSMRDVGVYVFFFQLGSPLQTLITVGVLQPEIPALVRAFRDGEEAWRGRMERLALKTLAAAAALGLLLYVAGSVASAYLNRAELNQGAGWFSLIIILAFSARSLGDLASYGLYSRLQDLAVPLLGILGAALSIAGSIVGVYLFGLFGVGVSMLTTASIIVTVRTVLIVRSRRANKPAGGRGRVGTNV